MALRGEVIYSAPALEIVCSPWLVGEPLAALARAASADWLRSLPADALGAAPVSLEVLNGGHYYYVAAAADDVRGAAAPRCAVASLRAKRSRDEATGAWRVRVWDRAGAPLAGATALLIGDTLATGTTLAGVLLAVVDELRQAGATCPPVYVYAIAGASAAEAALADAAAALRAAGGSLHLTFANAAFALWTDGTDLRFTGPDARWHPAALAELPAALGRDWAAADVKCACFDWGDRFRDAEAHLTELQHWCDGLPQPLPERLRRGLDAARAGAPWAVPA